MTDQIKIEISDYKELVEKLKKVKDSVKRSEIIAILRAIAVDTRNKARELAPESKKPHAVGRGNRKVTIQPGATKRGIRILAMTRSREPMVVVSPKGTKNEDSFYARQFVIPGHFIRKKGSKQRTNRRLTKEGSGNKVQPNPFMEQAQNATEGRVSEKSKRRVERLIERKLAKL